MEIKRRFAQPPQETGSGCTESFYEQNVKKFLSVGKSYISDLYQAEDCVIKAFCKIFKHIESFRGEGNLEGWARRIVVNECLNFIKSYKTVFYIDDINPSFMIETPEDEVIFDFSAQDLLDQLPDAYRMVFNLYVLKAIRTRKLPIR